MEMQSLEVLKTETKLFQGVSDTINGIRYREHDGWAVRQIVAIEGMGGQAFFVVFEDNR